MPNQDWSINTGSGVAGDVYGLAFTNSQRFSYGIDVPMSAFGIGVQKGARSDTVTVGADAGVLLGITMRQNVTESATRPGNGTVNLVVGTVMGVMLDGPIQVVLESPVVDGNIGVSAAGTFGGVDATHLACTNVRALKFPAAIGDVIPVMVYMTPTAIAA